MALHASGLGHNLLLGDGKVKLHFEKKRGFHNDNATEPA